MAIETSYTDHNGKNYSDAYYRAVEYSVFRDEDPKLIIHNKVYLDDTFRDKDNKENDKNDAFLMTDVSDEDYETYFAEIIDDLNKATYDYLKAKVYKTATDA